MLVIKMVETEGVGRIEVTPPEVMVWPAGQVVTEVMTVTVVVQPLPEPEPPLLEPDPEPPLLEPAPPVF